jgi:hypothetical protein
MSLPQTGGCGPGLFWIVAGLVLLTRRAIFALLRLLKKVNLLVIFFILLFFSAGFGSINVSHWGSFGNDDGWNFRGASEIRFFPLWLGTGEISLKFGENHSFGFDQAKPWNRKCELQIGPLVFYKLRGGQIRCGVEASYMLRPDIYGLNFTPFVDFWFGWRQGRLSGSFWGVVKREYGDGWVGQCFIEQAVELFSSKNFLLNANGIFQGVCGEEPHPWNRNLEILVGPEVRFNLVRSGCYVSYNSKARFLLRLSFYYWLSLRRGNN